MVRDWCELLEIFGTNDGSLPDIELNNLSGAEVIHGYNFVKGHSGFISSKDPSFWSTSRNCDVPFSYLDNPADLVVSGEAESFHLCFGGLKSPAGKLIPNIGLFVFADCLTFDYRMGPEWTKEAIEGLFELISAMSESFKNMEISHQANMNDDDGSIFKKYWTAYQNV